MVPYTLAIVIIKSIDKKYHSGKTEDAMVVRVVQCLKDKK